MYPPADLSIATIARPIMSRRRRAANPSRSAWESVLDTISVQGKPVSEAARERILLIAVGHHLEKSERVLIELLNSNGSGEIDLAGQRERAERLATDNRLYRRSAGQSGERAIAGLLEVLLPRDMLMRWLGAGAGLRGILTGCVIGALVPGPPYALYPLVISLYGGGASIGAVVGLLTGKALWNVHHMPPAFAVLGPSVAATYFLSNLLVPPLSGWIAEHVLSRWIG